MKQYDEYEINAIGTRDGEWREKNLSMYDVVFHMAGIVHQKERRGDKQLYYEVICKLAMKAKKIR